MLHVGPSGPAGLGLFLQRLIRNCTQPAPQDAVNLARAGWKEVMARTSAPDRAVPRQEAAIAFQHEIGVDGPALLQQVAQRGRRDPLEQPLLGPLRQAALRQRLPFVVLRDGDGRAEPP